MTMGIDYEKIDISLNKFGNKIINMIKDQYGYCLINAENIPAENFIVVEKPTKEDIEFFCRQNGIENQEDFNISNVPSAHGGRTKNDGKIHIYPYSPNSFQHCNSTEEIIEICKRDIVIHEIFHYFIKPKISYPEGTIEAKFGHFIAEGLVQGYAEVFAKNHNLPMPNSNYRKNVNVAYQLLSHIPNAPDLDYIVFNSSIEDLVNFSLVGNEMFENFKANELFYSKLNSLIERSATSAGLASEQISSMQRYYSKMDDKNEIMKDLSDNIQTAFADNDSLAQKYINELNLLTGIDKMEDKNKENVQSLETEGPKLVRSLPQQSSDNSTSPSNDGKINLTLILIVSLSILFMAFIGICIIFR